MIWPTVCATRKLSEGRKMIFNNQIGSAFEVPTKEQRLKALFYDRPTELHELAACGDPRWLVEFIEIHSRRSLMDMYIQGTQSPLQILVERMRWERVAFRGEYQRDEASFLEAKKALGRKLWRSNRQSR